VVPVYVIAIIAACWHFGYGIFLFIAKWGLVTGERARKRMTWVGAAIAVLFAAMGLYTLYAFQSYPITVPQDPSQSKAVEEGQFDQQPEHPAELPK
jgi:succinate dehydrogenase / fumarate reductase cytochrome b subunit